MSRFIITLNDETETVVKGRLEEVIHQAQNGVTNFSTQGILANILFDMNFDFYDNEDDDV